ncbi:hypothetical protein N7516_010286 [Penicillium verrucosum]|uniref:uncharacterized protein n=1 Tax=Penicillium verrucosum TaxID=60171 RepID=UPI0025456A4E|nr:uncharacterized protein N7516_010286 [Penicillium verrucosum]KAJ5922583.1 hypothetical protein N7516_010286 [Penicillium verrucosum]
MFSQRNLGRLSQRASQQMRSAPVRSTIQRRFNSAEAKPSWIVDNEFNRERAAVKHHAASTSGTPLAQTFHLCRDSLPYWWRSQRLQPLVRALGALGAHGPLEERTEYPYQNIRVKNFPWGDGDKTIFWNSDVNYHNKDKAT